MPRPALSRATLVLTAITLLVPAVAVAENVAVLRIESFDAVLADTRRVMEALQGEDSAEQVLQPLLGVMQIPGVDILDRGSPMLLVFPMEGMTLGARGLLAVVPLNDPDGAAGRLGEADETGVLTIQAGEGNDVAAKIHGGSLVIGQSRELVGAFDPAGAMPTGPMPPGNIAIDINLEPLTPVILQGLEMGKQVVAGQMAENPSEDLPDPETLGAMLDLYFALIRDAVNNTSRIQFSLELAEEHILMHNRWLPRAGSTLEGLLKAQSGDLPKLARYIDPASGIASSAGQINLTPAFLEAMSGYLGRYAEFINGLMPMMAEQADLAPLAAMMTGMEGMAETWSACYRGDFAGSFSFGGEHGFQVVQLAGVKDAAACEAGWDSMTAMLDETSAASDQEPFMTVERGALKTKGVVADRQVMRFAVPAGAGEDDPAAAMMQDWFGENGLTTYYGISGDHMITAAGPGAEDAFKGMVTTLALREKKLAKRSGISSQTFEPLQTGPGFFIAFDMSSMFESIFSAIPEDQTEGVAWVGEFLAEMPEGAARIVEGVRLDPDAVHVTVAARMDLLEEIGRLAARSEEMAAAHAEEHAAGEAHDHDHDHDHEDLN